MMNAATGKFDGKNVIIDDGAEASQIYNKGYFGLPQKGGGLQLDIIEAIYLVEAGKLNVRKGRSALGIEKLFRIGNDMLDGFEIKYLVYRDMRQRGYVVKAGADPLDFRALPRGGAPGKTPSKYWILAISERSLFALDEVVKVVKKVVKVKKTLLLAVVDEESDLTYYKAKVVKPHGKVATKADFHIADALFLEDRVMVLDGQQAQMLHSIEFFGKPIGDHLQLSLLETAHLLNRGLIKLKSAETGRKMSLASFMKTAEKVQPDFQLRLKIYDDLKARGVLVKTGFKYGSHFRAYEGDPDDHHARYLVHAFPPGFTGMWAEVSRAVRLAHGVKKDILLARPMNDKAEYLRLKRIRP